MKMRLAASLCVLLFLAGCATTSRDGDFVSSVDFTPYDTFAIRPALMTGFNWHSADEQVVERLTAQVLAEELEARGFEAADAEEADFYAVAKWRKYSGYRTNFFDPVDPPQGRFEDDRPGGGFAVRHSLVLEIYDGPSGELFWRAELPDIFEAIRFSESRVKLALRKAIRDFPKRVEKDPNLPAIR